MCECVSAVNCDDILRMLWETIWLFLISMFLTRNYYCRLLSRNDWSQFESFLELVPGDVWIVVFIRNEMIPNLKKIEWKGVYTEFLVLLRGESWRSIFDCFDCISLMRLARFTNHLWASCPKATFARRWTQVRLKFGHGNVLISEKMC